MVLLVVAALVGCAVNAETESVPQHQLEVAPLEAFTPPRRTVVAPGDTLESVCRRLAGDDWWRWSSALGGELDPRRLRPGTTFDGATDAGGRLISLTVTLDLRRELRLNDDGDAITVEWVEREVERSVIRLEGVVESSLFAAVEAAGAGPELAVRVAEIYQWDIDFLRDLREGDEFVVVAEEQRIDGELYGYGPIYAARFVNQGRRRDAVAYPDAGGTLGYYDLDGTPLRKQFLRSPLKFTRITSSFSMSRFHPVLKRRMPHYGVDYGAPTGTPAHVTGDGTVTFVGRSGGAGNMVTVRHANGYETSYLHLSRFGPGIRRGVRVSQGQVIGYVGATGWATGPHLDYRVKLNGRWINPLSIASPPVEPLTEARLGRFLSHALAVIPLLEGEEPPLGARC